MSSSRSRRPYIPGLDACASLPAARPLDRRASARPAKIAPRANPCRKGRSLAASWPDNGAAAPCSEPLAFGQRLFFHMMVMRSQPAVPERFPNFLSLSSRRRLPEPFGGEASRRKERSQQAQGAAQKGRPADRRRTLGHDRPLVDLFTPGARRNCFEAAGYNGDCSDSAPDTAARG